MHTSGLEVLDHDIATFCKSPYKSIWGYSQFTTPFCCIKKIKRLREREKWTGRRNTHARPSSLRISIVTLFLLRPMLRNQGLVPSTSSSRHTLRGSPVFGGSTLTTSAPKCLATVKISHVSLEQRRGKTSEKRKNAPEQLPREGSCNELPEFEDTHARQW